MCIDRARPSTVSEGERDTVSGMGGHGKVEELSEGQGGGVPESRDCVVAEAQASRFDGLACVFLLRCI